MAFIATPAKRTLGLKKIQTTGKLKVGSKVTKLQRGGVDELGIPTIGRTKRQATKFDVLTQKSSFEPVDLDDDLRNDLKEAQWIIVSSSNVVAYKRVKTELWVMFANGSVYAWNDRNGIRSKNLARSSSKGRYIWYYLYGKHTRIVRKG